MTITITDQFCGAGGSSLGAVAAGAELKLALNHWPLAIETHNTNFPQADHDCTDISACDPRRYRSTTMLLTSPECTNHSVAKGKQRKWQQQLDMFGMLQLDPAEERSRATMWDVCRFAEVHHYQIIIVENVVEARAWAPFPAWLQAMVLLGYEYQCVYLNSMHVHPTPQSRDRMYVVFWKNSMRRPNLTPQPHAWCQQCQHDCASVQSWKRPDRPWGKYKQQYVYRCPTCATEVTPYYYCAANIIDWAFPAPRIGERTRPLKDKTRARIQRGLEKFGYHAQLIGNYSPGWARPVSEPTGTVTTADHHAVCVPPFLINQEHGSCLSQAYALTEPAPTQTTAQGQGIVIPPFLLETQWSHAQNDRSTDLIDALPTQTSQLSRALVIPPFVLSYYGTGQQRTLDQPLPTQTSLDRHALIVPPFITSYYTRLTGQMAALSGLDEPVPTVPGRAVHYVVQPHETPTVDDCGFRMLQPCEIGKAMAFPESYQVLGNQREKVKQYGNAVTPPVMRWLVERCMEIL